MYKTTEFAMSRQNEWSHDTLRFRRQHDRMTGEIEPSKVQLSYVGIALRVIGWGAAVAILLMLVLK